MSVSSWFMTCWQAFNRGPVTLRLMFWVAACNVAGSAVAMSDNGVMPQDLAVPLDPALLADVAAWPEAERFQTVLIEAAERATRDYQVPEPAAQEVALALTYDQYRALRFRPEAAWWRGQSRFEVQLFHPGFLFPEPVNFTLWTPEGWQEQPFDPGLFQYHEIPDALAEGLRHSTGYAGFRLHYPVNRADYADEVAAFLGASYFRLVGPGQAYGLSARGLALDTAAAHPEEFPLFSHFWLLPPEPEAATMMFFALLDSPALTGAYQFEITVHADTTMAEVRAVLFPRRSVDKLGLAPLTSMFLHGAHSQRRFDDFRPQVHDSDGLQMLTAHGEWLWRPLQNPRQLRVTALLDSAPPRGFGLLQRERDFAAYLDLEAAYHRRPSLWVEPLSGAWGRGQLELVEIPTNTETADNMVAYWVPEQPMRPGQPLTFHYRLSTRAALPPEFATGWVKRTRVGWGAVPGEPEPPPPSVRRIVVDFAGVESTLGALDKITLEPELTVSAGEIRALKVQALPEPGGWRVSFLLAPEGREPADMRLFLRDGQQRVSETWTWVWYPDEL